MRRDGESLGLAVVAVNSGVDKDRKIRRYLEKQEFKFTTLVKGEHSTEPAFGMKLSGSAILIGADGKVLWRGLTLDRPAILQALESSKTR